MSFMTAIKVLTGDLRTSCLEGRWKWLLAVTRQFDTGRPQLGGGSPGTESRASACMSQFERPPHKRCLETPRAKPTRIPVDAYRVRTRRRQPLSTSHSPPSR